MDLTSQNRRGPKRKRTKVAKKNAGLVALKKVNKLASDLKKENEVKHVPTNITLSPVPATPAIQLMNYPAQGVDQDERVGGKCAIIGFSARWYVYNNSVSNATLSNITDTVCRIIIFKRKQGYTSSPSLLVNEVLQTADFSGTSTAPRNPDFTKLYKVYYDNFFVIQRQGLTHDGTNYNVTGGTMYAEYFKKFKKPIQIDFSDATQASNNDQIYILSLTPSASPNSPDIAGSFDLRYTDL